MGPISTWHLLLLLVIVVLLFGTRAWRLGGGPQSARSLPVYSARTHDNQESEFISERVPRNIPARSFAASMGLVVALALMISACGGDSPAYETYKKFVSAVVRGDCDMLYALAEKDAIAYVDNHCKRRSMTIVGKTIELGSVASNVASIRPNSTPFNDPISMERTIESESRSSDRKTVDLVVIEKSF